VVGLRISLDEHDPTGLDEAIARRACVRLAEGALVDYLSVTTGTSSGRRGSGHIAPEMSFANAYTAPLSQSLKELVDVPVIVAGRINQPQEAERVLELGQADACVMTRALICDPLLAQKAAAGKEEEIRACIACNQACIGHFHQGFAISCIQHPETGRELTYATRVAALAPRRVLVVGGDRAG